MMVNASNNGNSCAYKCWLAGVIFGLLVAAILIKMAGWGVLISLVVGVIGTLGAAWVLASYYCEEVTREASAVTAPQASPVVSTPAPELPADDAFADEAAGEPDPQDVQSSDGGRPVLYDSAPDTVDELKKIKGVGPALEKTLNELGIYTFAQIEVWTAEDIAWVDDNLRFKGRIERDDWMAQAKGFRTGGNT